MADLIKWILEDPWREVDTLAFIIVTGMVIKSIIKAGRKRKRN